MEACGKLHMYNAEDVFELLKFHDKELTLDHYVEIWKKALSKELRKLRNLSLS
jgi:hypothetical protein